MFPLYNRMFPSTNLQDLNLDWIIQTIKELQEQEPADVSEIEESLSHMNKSIKSWDVNTNGKILFVGNSYGQRGNPTYAQIVGINLGLTEGLDYWNIAYHGASFVGSSSTPTYLDKLTEWCEANTAEKENIGAIIIVGGVNDARPSRCNLVTSAMEQFNEYVKTNLPHAQIYAGFCAVFTYESEEKSDRTIAAMRTVLQSYYASSAFGWTYLNGIENVMLNRTLISSDGLHPSQEGLNKIGAAVTQNLLSGHCNFYERISTTASPVVEGDALNLDITSEINNGMVHNAIFCRSFTFNTPQTFALNSWIQLCKAALPCNLFTSFELGYYPLVLTGVNGGTIQCIARLNYDYTTQNIRAQLRFIANPDNEIQFKAIGNVIIDTTNNMCFI